MASIKRAGRKPRRAQAQYQGLPCLILILLSILVVFWLLYAAMKSG
jgi:hypothetical protein